MSSQEYVATADRLDRTTQMTDRMDLMSITSLAHQRANRHRTSVSGVQRSSGTTPCQRTIFGSIEMAQTTGDTFEPLVPAGGEQLHLAASCHQQQGKRTVK
ncbi:hypothetical protein MJO29_004682 [Puccinia striiformis f. sp. tritici]|uniref:Uncharacterized protein n=1 Tax=Puccinia striiformis TaxID=27350 RepID=A0A2S4UAY0_9BASI|nr:hypothetical protein MJO29_004682 [Puccinia striiformis f. sp. tritici]POV94458.1 hypothetical protein PSTT_16849 [Puccinia striiformis]